MTLMMSSGKKRAASAPSLLPLAPDIWLEPNALDTVSGGRVSNAFDLSGFAHHGVQGASGNQPEKIAGAGPNGVDVYRFGSRPDFFEIAHDAGLAGSDWTFAMVLSTTDTDASLFSKGSSGVPIDAFIFSGFGSHLALSNDLTTGTTSIRTGAWLWCAGTRADSGTDKTIVNGVTDATGVAGVRPTGTDPIRVGQRADGFGALTGDIACLAAWNRALSAGELLTLGAYFTARFGL